jgi:hypothetical protein
MPLFVLSILVQVALVVHVIKTGRNTLWIWVLVLLPFAGPIAYAVVEIVPDLLGSRSARRAARGVRQVLDPGRDLRRATAEATLSDTIETRTRLAEELLRRGDAAAAVDAFRACLRGLYEHDPNLMLGLARAQFAAGRAAEARDTLEELKRHNPGFKSADGHLLYARALAAAGDGAAAEAAFRSVMDAYPGPEATVRYAQFLKGQGRGEQARKRLIELLATAELVPKHARKAQAEWLALAREELRGL